MRLVSLAHAYPRWDGDVAGAFVERLNMALTRRGHNVSVVVPADRGAGGSILRHGVTMHRVRYGTARAETLAYGGQMVEAARTARGAVSAGLLMLSQARTAALAVRADRAELMHAHWWIPAGVSAWICHAVSRRPYVVTIHGTDAAILQSSAVARKLARRVLGAAGAVTAVSSYLATCVARSLEFDVKRIAVQPMPLDVEQYERVPTSGGGGVVTVGRLVPQKRLRLLFDAMAHLKQQGKPLQLTVVGDGPEREALETYARETGIADSTRFVGSVPPSSIADLLVGADVFAFPASNEGLGLAVAEAFLLGVPVVAARDGGGVTDLVPAVGPGRLVDAANPKQLAEAIHELQSSPRCRAQAVEHGRSLRQRFDADSVARMFERIYQRAIER